MYEYEGKSEVHSIAATSGGGRENRIKRRSQVLLVDGKADCKSTKVVQASVCWAPRVMLECSSS
eukprot:5308065-Amphidinium_carterae.1